MSAEDKNTPQPPNELPPDAAARILQAPIGHDVVHIGSREFAGSKLDERAAKKPYLRHAIYALGVAVQSGALPITWDDETEIGDFGTQIFDLVEAIAIGMDALIGAIKENASGSDEALDDLLSILND